MLLEILESNTCFLFQVMIMDNGIPQLSSTTRVVIAVEDINDHAPEFDQKFYKVQIPATAKIDQPLFQVSLIGLTLNIFLLFPPILLCFNTRIHTLTFNNTDFLLFSSVK